MGPSRLDKMAVTLKHNEQRKIRDFSLKVKIEIFNFSINVLQGLILGST